MQEKNKKNLLNLIVLVAIALLLVSSFLPMFCIDYSDIQKDIGNEDPKKYSKVDASLFLWHYSEFDFTNPNSSYEFHSYRLFNLISFKTGEPVDIESNLIFKEDQEGFVNRGDVIFSNNLINIIYAALAPLGLALFFYMSYKGIKNIHFKKTRYFLYIGISASLVIIAFFVLFYYYLYIADFYNWGYTNYMTFDYGFYTAITSVVLFLTAFFIQKYLIYYKKTNREDINH